jgi:putative transposase
VRGAQVIVANRAATVIAVHSTSNIQLRVVGTQELIKATLGQIRSVCDLPEENARRCNVAHATEEQLAQAKKWVSAFEVRAVEDWLSTQDLEDIAEELGVSVRTVRRHFALFRQDPNPLYQLPCAPGPEVGSRFLPKPVEGLIKDVLPNYLTEERWTIRAITQEVRRQATAAGLRKPSYSSVRARIRALSPEMVARRRHGRVRGSAMAAPAGEPSSVRKALEMVQMDHAIVDLIVVDPETREEIGRPWLTLAIDVATRCILGFYLGWECPSQTSVALALSHACCPKDLWLRHIGYTGEWHPLGLMKSMGWDNAKCFKATGLVQGLRKFGIEPKYRKVRTPTHGAHIERYIGSYMGKLHMLPGTTFSNTKDRGDYRSCQRAVMSLPELCLWTVHQMNGVYHNTPHSSLDNRTPLEAWNEAWTVDGVLKLPHIPSDRRLFHLSLLPFVPRSVGREGIQRFALKYTDPAIYPLIGNGRKYHVAHDPRDISKIYLRRGDDDWVDVPWRDRSKPPVSLWELERAKRQAKDKGRDSANERVVFDELQAARNIEDPAVRTTRQQRRNRNMRPAAAPDEVNRIDDAVVDFSTPSSAISDPLGGWSG